MNNYKTQTFSEWLREKTRDPKIDTQDLLRRIGLDRYTFAALIDARITPEQMEGEVLEKLYDFIGERYVKVKPAIAANKGRKRDRDSQKIDEDDLFQAIK